MNKRALSSVLNFISERAPAGVAQIGDLLTLDEFSRWRKDPRLIEPTIRTIEVVKRDFWRPLRALVPDIVYTLGNHEARPYDHLIDHAPAFLSMLNLPEIPYQEWLGFGPYVNSWCLYKQGILRGNVMFSHGEYSGPGAARQMMKGWGTNGMSGHSHRAGRYEHRSWARRLIWQEAGFLGDIDQFYNSPISNWHTGFATAWIDPRAKDNPLIEFVPVDYKSGRFWFDGKEYRP